MMGALGIPEKTRSKKESVIIKLVWNRRNQEEVKLAEEKFKKNIRSGWMAYSINADREKVQIFTFNPALKEIFLIPLVEGG